MFFLKKHWLIISILILSAFFRLFQIQDYMEFLGDQGRDVVIARDFLKNGNLFFIGPQTSIGNMYLGPYYYYLFVVPGLILFNFSPIGPAIIIALLGVLTVYLVYFVSKTWFSTSTAYICSFLYAISPVVIKYSNFSWNPNIMPLFALIFIYFLINKKIYLATLAFIFALNSHYLALLLLPIGLIIWLFNRTSFKSLLISLVIFIISLTPQILFDLKHHGQNFNAITTFFSQRETTVNLKAYKAIPELYPLFTQINTRLLSGKNIIFGQIISIIFIVSLIYVLYIQFKSKKINKYFIYLILWNLIGLIGLALYKQHIYDHYFGFIFPAVFILFGYLISHFPKIIIFMILIPLTIFSLLENPLRWPAPKQLATTTSIIDSIISSSAGKPFNLALLAKMNYDPGYRYILAEKKALVKLLPEITTQLYVICEPFQIDCQPINNPEWSIAAFGWAKIDSQWEINGIKIFKLIPNTSGR